MGSNRAIVGVSFVALMAAVFAVGCGGSGSNSSSEPGSELSSAPSTEFVGKGQNGRLATLGKVADDEEREAASRVIEESLQAREAGDWEAQCSSLATVTVKQLEKSGTVLGTQPGCAKTLEMQAEPAPPGALANTMTGPIDVLRTFGDERGLAFYHGPENKDYVIPVKKEGGEWKVEAAQEEEIR
ncbi:MAG: hypothetical protein WBL45_03230 [Solirubrobacterales bacterium]